MQGTIHTYFQSLPVFISSNAATSKNIFVFIPGLKRGFFDCPYSPALFKAVTALNLTWAQPLLSSSYNAFGTSTIYQDAQEITQLLLWLIKNRDAQSFVICCQSSGCNMVVRMMSFLDGKFSGGSSEQTPYTPRTPDVSAEDKKNLKQKIVGLVLQAPVSDRGFLPDSIMNSAKLLKQAQDMIKNGKGFDLLPTNAFKAPITAYRFNSFMGVETEDDLFATDFTRAQFEKVFGSVDIPTMFAFSMEDEYVPLLWDDEDQIIDMMAIWKDIIQKNIGKRGGKPKEKDLVIVNAYEGAKHELTDKEDEQQYVQDVVKFVKNIWA